MKTLLLILFLAGASIAEAQPSFYAVPRSAPVTGGGLTGFFVAASGNDANAGTQASPWKTFGYALTNSTSDSSVYLNGGDTFPITNAQLQHAGFITSYGTGRATLYSNGGDTLAISNLSNVTISNLTVFNTNGNNGIAIYNTINISNVTVANNDVSGCGKSPVAIGGQQGGCDILAFAYGSATTTNIVIANNNVHDSYTDGIFFWGDAGRPHKRPLIYGNTVTNIYGNTSYISGIGIVPAFAVNALVYLNSVDSCGQRSGDVGGGPGGIVAVNATGMMFSNIVSRIRATPNGVDGVGIDADWGTDNFKLLYNITHDNEGCGILAYAPTNFEAGFNISINDGLRTTHNESMRLSGAIGQANIYNNTIISGGTGGQACIYDETASSGWTNLVLNNILVSAKAGYGQVITHSSNYIFKGNSYLCSGTTSNFLVAIYTNGVPIFYNSLVQFKADGYESGTGYQADPSLYNRLGTINPSNQIPYLGSVAIGHAVDVTAYGITAPPHDILNNPIGATYNIGAVNTNKLFAPSSLLTNIVAAWPMQETSGTNFEDFTGNGHLGTWYGSPAWTNTFFSGGIYLAVSSQTGNASANAFGLALSNTPPMSIAYWMKGGAAGDTTFQNWNPTDGTYILTSGLMAFNVDNVNTWSNTIAITTTDPHLIVVTTDGANLLTYVDGTLAATGAAWFGGITWSATTQTLIGGGSNPWILGQSAIWRRALTSGEVSTLYNSGSGVAYPFQ